MQILQIAQMTILFAVKIKFYPFIYWFLLYSTYISNGACLTDDAGTAVQTTCTGAGDYTFMEIAERDPGTFSNYKIAATLESGLYIYVSQKLFLF